MCFGGSLIGKKAAISESKNVNNSGLFLNSKDIFNIFCRHSNCKNEGNILPKIFFKIFHVKERQAENRYL